MPEEPVVSTPPSEPAEEPEFSLATYRAERESPPVEEPPAEEKPAEAEKPSETAPDSEPGEEEQEQKPEEQPAKGKGGFQRKIDKLIAQKAELERQLAERTAALPQAPVEAKAVPAGEPQLGDYASYEAYVAALTDWKVDQRFQAKEAENKAAIAAEKLRVQQAEFGKKLEAARTKYTDFDEVVGDAPQITEVTRDFILDSALGTDVMYQLAQHPQEAAQLATLPPIQQIKILTQLESYLSPAPEAKPQAITKAPTPIRPVGSGTAVVQTYKDGMDYESFKRWRNSGGGR